MNLCMCICMNVCMCVCMNVCMCYTHTPYTRLCPPSVLQPPQPRPGHVPDEVGGRRPSSPALGVQRAVSGGLLQEHARPGGVLLGVHQVRRVRDPRERAHVQRVRQRLVPGRQPDDVRADRRAAHDVRPPVGHPARRRVHHGDPHGALRLRRLRQVQPDARHHGVGPRALLHAAGGWRVMMSSVTCGAYIFPALKMLSPLIPIKTVCSSRILVILQKANVSSTPH